MADRGKLTEQVRKNQDPQPFLRKQAPRRVRIVVPRAAWLVVAAVGVALSVWAIVLFGDSDPVIGVEEELATIREENKAANRQIELQDLGSDDRGAVLTTVPLPSLFGGLIGRDVSVARLVSRYEDLAVRLPDLFGAFDPLIHIEDDDNDLLAQLIVGPFETMEDARLFCRTLRLEHGLPCDATRYSGETFLPR